MASLSKSSSQSSAAPELATSGEQGDSHVSVQGHATQASGPSRAPSQPRKPGKGSSRKQKQPSPLLGWPWLLLAGAAVGALALWRLVLPQKKESGKTKPVQVSKEKVFSLLLQPTGQPPSHPQVAPHPLQGKTLVVSDRLDVEGVQTRFGSDAWRSGRQPSAQSHGTISALVAAGAQAQAVVPGECLGLGPLFSGAANAIPNPMGAGRSNGGGDYGAAVAVAAGHADLALAVDELGSARVPAACCGVYAFRPTAGVLPLEGASTASHSLAAPSLLARDPQTLMRVGEVLRLPGGSSRGDVVSYLVAEDYFRESQPCMRRMVPAVIAAVKRWAGPDQAKGLSLCEWLYHRIEGLQEFMEEEEEGVLANGGKQQGQQPRRHTQRVLQALAAAAETVRQWEFVQKYGKWARGVTEMGGGRNALPEEVLHFQNQAEEVTEERYRVAQAVMAELSNSMRFALQEGYIFVLPTTPGEAPPTSSGSSSEVQNFRQRSLEFSALSALAGVPQVTVPLPVPDSLPLSISLMSLHKRDLTLLQAAAKLGPILAEEAAKLAAKQQQAQQPPMAGRPVKATAPATGGGVATGKKGGKKGGKEQAEDKARKARAEGCKEDGNAAFKGGRYDDAVRHYSAAVQLDPQNHIYYANRALAYLKLGLYSHAEEDCDLALQRELNVKALLRRGSARVAQGNAEGAKADFKQALALEPQNRQAREELEAIQLMEEQLHPNV